ncbi:MAG: multicopper oxidase family protein, partial [Candidatus Eremiobacteraeota bacterium]|nr:multicopper oxidase family protein [Candidatus Eremiobacteraeota bacterium]
VAEIDPTDNLPTFVYHDDYDSTPTIRVDPGDTIVLDLYDGLPPMPHMAGDLNMHFHGLDVSPLRPSDDVLTMLAMPGQGLEYRVNIPNDQPPGLYWYHPHVHGQTNYQVGQGGMSGAIVVNGLERRFPGLSKMPEQLLIVRQLGTGGGDVTRAPQAGAPVTNPTPCAAALGGNAVLTVNREYQPRLVIEAGKPQFFRILNATGHRTLDLAIDGTPLHVIAFDGYPVSTYPGQPAIRTMDHVVLPPAARVEFVAAPAQSAALRTRCYDSGPAGDPDPEQLLLTMRARGNAHAAYGAGVAVSSPAEPLSPNNEPAALPPPVARRTVTFTENARGFYINGKAFSPDAKPTFVVRTGTVEAWTVQNLTGEVHAFHLHQAHFLVQKVDGATVAPLWRDTVVVPHRTCPSHGPCTPGTIVVLADFRNPAIRGTFLFHCHILDHEDRGMMAKIRAI